MDFTLGHLPVWSWAWVLVVLILAGFSHGAIGFGFPLVATPLLALVMDYKTAVLVSVLPGFCVTLINTFSGEGLWRRFKRFWFMPVLALFGAFIGTYVLLIAPPAPFILLLALLLLVYLYRERIGKLRKIRLRRWPRWQRKALGALAGFAGGFFEATANVGNGPYLIYFMLLKLRPDALVQVLNMCFLAGKSAQLGGWISTGTVSIQFWALMFGFSALSTMALFAGEAVRLRINQATYIAWLRRFLWAMVVLLLVQFCWAVFIKR